MSKKPTDVTYLNESSSNRQYNLENTFEYPSEYSWKFSSFSNASEVVQQPVVAFLLWRIRYAGL